MVNIVVAGVLGSGSYQALWTFALDIPFLFRMAVSVLNRAASSVCTLKLK